MKIYNYDPVTYIYTYSTEADASPLEPGVYLLPAHSTLDPVPTIGSNEVAVYSPGATWQVLPDYRGTRYWLSYDSEHFINDIGISIPDGAVTIRPDPPVSLLKQWKAEEIKSACGLAIVAGISSNVLGALHSYPTDQVNQLNINGLVTESLLASAGDDYKFWCADQDGIWARRSHTKAQIQALGLEISQHVKTQQSHYEQRLSILQNATTKAEVEEIMW